MAITKLWQGFRQSPLQTIHQWQNQRITWLIMFATALFLELCALGFQYILMLDPCELCVYQRFAITLLMIAPIIMMSAPGNIPLRLIGYGLWIAGAIYGLEQAIIQTSNYTNFDPFNSSCNFRPTFPFDLPLYEWIPSVFMPTGICGADDWTFLTLNMAQWMVMIFGIYLIAAAACVISSAYCWICKK